MVVTTGFNFLALRYLQLDQTITIFFLTPLLVAALAGPLLSEWVGWHRMLAIVAGFLGVLLVMHPGIGTVHWAMLLALVATLGLRALQSRHALSRGVRSGRGDADLHAARRRAGPGAVRAGGLALAGETPCNMLLLASLGFWGGLGHWLLILAHRSAPAPVLAPFIYLGLIWMSALGLSRVRRRADAVDAVGRRRRDRVGTLSVRARAEGGRRSQSAAPPRTSPRNDAGRAA